MKKMITTFCILLIGVSLYGQVASYSFFSDFDDTSSGTNDLTAIGTGSPATAPILKSDTCRRYVDYSAGGYLEDPSPSINLTDEITVAFWMRASDISSDQKLVGQGFPSSRGFSIGVKNNFLVAELFSSNGNVELLNPASPINEWVHVTVVFADQNSIEIYINGSASANLTNSPTWSQPNPGDPLRLGVAPWDVNSFRYTGDMDDVYIYNTALIASEINSLYNDENICYNDVCGLARTIDEYTNQVGTNIYASVNNADAALRSCSEDPSEAGAGVWYRYMGYGYDVIVSTEHDTTDFDTEILVFSGDCDNLVCYAGNDQGGASNTSKVAFYAAEDQVYYIYLDGGGSAIGTFELSIEDPAYGNTYDDPDSDEIDFDYDNDCSTPSMLDFSERITRSGLVGSCNIGNVGRDQFFEYETRTDTLFWESYGPGFPGITIWSINDSTEIQCYPTGNSGKLYGWDRGEEIIIQIYDAISDFPEGDAIGFCLRDILHPPSNDQRSGAEPIAVSEQVGCDESVDFQLYGATKSIEIVDGLNLFEENDVWFTFVALDTVHFIQKSNQELDLQLYNDLDNLLSTFENNEKSYLLNGLEIGKTYKIRAYDRFTYQDPYNDENYSLCIGGVHPQNNCADALEIQFAENCVPQLFSFDGSTKTINNCYGADIWFKISIPISGNIVVETTSPGSSYDTNIALYKEDCKTPVAGASCFNDNNGADDHELFYFNNEFPNTTYYIKVADSERQFGTFSLCVRLEDPTLAIPGDSCSVATPLIVTDECTPELYTFSGATNGVNECGGNGIWFSAIVPASGNIAFKTSSGDTKDTQIKIYTGDCQNLSLQSKDCQQENNNIEDSRHEAIVLHGLTSGDMIYLVVDDDFGLRGTVGVCAVDPGPLTVPGDCRSTVTQLDLHTSCSSNDIYTLRGATAGDNECSNNGVWFSAVVPASGELVFATGSASSSPASFIETDINVSVYKLEFSNLVVIKDCFDENNAGDGNHERVALDNLDQGDVIYFVVSNDDGDEGIFRACVFEEIGFAEPSDNCLGATPMVLKNSQATPDMYSFKNATNGIDECEDNGVWFSVIVPPSGSLIFKTSAPGSNNDTKIKAFEGSCGALQLLSEDCQDEDNSLVEDHEILPLHDLTPGEEVFFVVDDRGSKGTFSVLAYDPGEIRLPGDKCSEALALSPTLHCDTPLIYTYMGATEGLNECGDVGVWFSLIVPPSGQLFISTYEAGFDGDPEITVFRGSCGNLQIIGEDCRDEDNAIDKRHEEVYLDDLIPGETIYLMVSESDDDDLLFGLCVTSGLYANCVEDDAFVSEAMISFTSDSIYRTKQTISSNIELGPYSKFLFRTEKSINLNEQFAVPQGTELIAEMAPCAN